MKRIVVVFFLIACLNLNSAESVFNFLRYNGSARSWALGGAFVSVTDDPSALIFNPASVATNKTRNFAFTFLKHILDVNSGNVIYHRKFENLGDFAANVIFTNYGSFDRTDKNGQPIGTFTANDLALGVTYANVLDTNLYYGITTKFIFSNIDKYTSSAFAFDLGLLYNIPEKRTSIGISILNFGTQLSTYDGTREALPLDLRVGISHRLRGLPLLLNFSFFNLNESTSKFFDKFLKFSLGGEFYLSENFYLRLGYDNNIRKYSSSVKDKGFSGFSGGVGLKFKELNFDYAVSQVGASAIFHRFSLYFDL